MAETILEEAGRLVGGDRGEDYGHPLDDFARTAAAWSALFGWDCRPEQVALAMIIVKMSRLAETPAKRDSVVDIAGYARTYEMVLERLEDNRAREDALQKIDESFEPSRWRLEGLTQAEIRDGLDFARLNGWDG